MAIIQTGVASGTTGGNLIVDPTFQAVRTADHPPEILGAYSMSLVSGALTTVTGGTVGSPQIVFSFRWAPATTTQLCMVRRVEIGFNDTTAFTSAQTLQWNMIVARSFTASQTGGTSAAFTQTNTGKQRTSMPNSAFAAGGNIQIANTAALSGSSFTLDTQYLASIGGPVTATVGSSIPMTPIFQHTPGDYPLILANNEGFVINNGQTMGAAGVGNLIVNVEWMELAATTGNAIAY
jgi:hypothetical protein